MPSSDSLNIDGFDLEDFDRIKRKWGLDQEQAEALALIQKGLPLSKFTDILTEEFWIRELLKDLEDRQCQHCKKFSSTARTKALQMYAEWAGLIGNKAKKKSRKEVTFDE